MIIRITDEKLFDKLQCEVTFPSEGTIQIDYSDGERRERLVAVGAHREDDFLNTFGFKIIA